MPTVIIAARLRFGDGVLSRPQLGEAVGAVVVGEDLTDTC